MIRLTVTSRNAVFLLICIEFCYAQNTQETVVLNPAFQEVAPCPCDLTQGSCDLRCCCDGDCPSNLKATFDYCIPGLPGGQDALPQEYKCSSDHFHKDDWFPFLCVMFEYNAFLGYFYQWQYKIGNNTPAFLQRLSSVFHYSYREEEARIVDDSPGTGYQYGVSIKTAKLLNTEIDLYGVLAVPQPTLSGQCLETAPVRYLKDIDTMCTYTMTNELCDSNTVLSSLFYVQNSSVTTGTKYFSVLQEDKGLVFAETNVIYYCASDASAYLKSSSGTTNVAGRVLFDYSLPTNPNCTDTCGNDICIDVNDLPNPDPLTTNSLPNQCADQRPNTPVNDNGICRNSVVEVQYTMTWEGKKIIKVDANIILADIPLRNGLIQNEITQKYSVNFVHNFTGVSAGVTDNFNNITVTSYERSGRVGYDFGKPIFSGSVVNNESATPPEFMYVNTNTTRQMAVFSAGVDGLCVNASRRTLKFGEDISTACSIQLALTDFNDCSGLRKLIINRLNTLMPADVLGRRGYNDVTNSGYWISVLREDLSSLCIVSEYFPVGLSPVDNRTGICWNITTGIHLDILYAESGRSNDYPIYEIIGARVSYTSSTWEVKCGSTRGTVCSDGDTQSFYLTSSVKFTKVPAQKPTPVPKYYEVPRPEDAELCPGDRCWDNFMYPLDGRFFDIGESKEYAFAMVGSAVLVFIGYLLVTRPWW